MGRSSFRFGLRLGLLGGAGFALMKVLQARRDEREQEAALRSTEPWPPITPAPGPAHQASSPSPAAPTPGPQPEAAPPPPVAVRPDSSEPPAKQAVATKEAEATWVDPEGRGGPPPHPPKGKPQSPPLPRPRTFRH